MKLPAFFLAIICSFFCFAQEDYWQQQVNYTIDVQLNDHAKTLTGFEQIEYINHSPDTLLYIWFHIWPNAYKNSSTAWSRQSVAKTIGKKNRGFIDSLNFKVDGVSALTEPDPEHIDVLKLLLPVPLLPGKSIKIETGFFVKLPKYTSRLGYSNNSYYISQWYPKPAVYDSKGWHPMPYLNRGEFYSEFGNFIVNISVPGDYIIAATGSMQNTDELNRYKLAGTSITNNKPAGKPVLSQADIKKLQYKAENVHDFAWFADKDFKVRYSIVQLKGGKQVDLFSFFKSTNQSNWDISLLNMSKVVSFLSDKIGEYPYPVVNAVEGIENSFSGGMEYPMICLINFTYDLPGIITHEVAHNWFYGIVASNERDHAWMDEGFTSFFTDSFFRNGLLKSENIPIKELDSDPIDQPSEKYKDWNRYFFSVYAKSANWLLLLQTKIGTSAFEKGIKAYYERWKFRHPYPEDFKRIMEEVSGQNLDEIFQLLYKKGNT